MHRNALLLEQLITNILDGSIKFNSISADYNVLRVDHEPLLFSRYVSNFCAFLREIKKINADLYYETIHKLEVCENLRWNSDQNHIIHVELQLLFTLLKNAPEYKKFVNKEILDSETTILEYGSKLITATCNDYRLGDNSKITHNPLTSEFQSQPVKKGWSQGQYSLTSNTSTTFENGSNNHSSFFRSYDKEISHQEVNTIIIKELLFSLLNELEYEKNKLTIPEVPFKELTFNDCTINSLMSKSKVLADIFKLFEAEYQLTYFSDFMQLSHTDQYVRHLKAVLATKLMIEFNKTSFNNETLLCKFLCIWSAYRGYSESPFFKNNLEGITKYINQFFEDSIKVLQNIFANPSKNIDFNKVAKFNDTFDNEQSEKIVGKKVAAMMNP